MDRLLKHDHGLQISCTVGDAYSLEMLSMRGTSKQPESILEVMMIPHFTCTHKNSFHLDVCGNDDSTFHMNSENSFSLDVCGLSYSIQENHKHVYTCTSRKFSSEQAYTKLVVQSVGGIVCREKNSCSTRPGEQLVTFALLCGNTHAHNDLHRWKRLW